MEENNKNKNISEESEQFSISGFFKKKENQYILKVFGLSLILYVLAGSYEINEGSSLLYFLALIASAIVVNGYEKVKESNSGK